MRLHLAEEGWSLGRTRRDWRVSPESAIKLLDPCHAISVTGSPPVDSLPIVVRFLIRAIKRGTALISAATDVAESLPSTLSRTIQRPFTGKPGDLLWDIAAVVQRRAAIRPAITAAPPVSIVLVSRREDLVVPMVKRLANLDYPNFEIIVGLHGIDTEMIPDMFLSDIPLTVKHFPQNQVFGSVVNEAFSLASGDLVTKIDDDDYYSDEHIWDLVAAHAYSGACLVGKSTTTIYLEEIDTTVRRNYGVKESYTHRVAGGTMLLRKDDLQELGGWPHVPRAVDTALISEVRAHGGSIYQPHDIGYVYVRGSDGGHTWNTHISTFLRNADEQWVGLYAHRELGTNT